MDIYYALTKTDFKSQFCNDVLKIILSYNVDYSAEDQEFEYYPTNVDVDSSPTYIRIAALDINEQFHEGLSRTVSIRRDRLKFPYLIPNKKRSVLIKNYLYRYIEEYICEDNVFIKLDQHLSKMRADYKLRNSKNFNINFTMLKKRYSFPCLFFEDLIKTIDHEERERDEIFSNFNKFRKFQSDLLKAEAK